MWLIVLIVAFAFILIPLADLGLWELKHRIAERQAREWKAKREV